MPDTETLQAGPQGPRRRSLVPVAVITLVLVVLAALALAGYAYVRTRTDVTPTPGPSVSVLTPRPSASPGTALVLPERFGTYQRDDRSRVETPVDTGDDVATASAYYDLNGVRQVLLVGAEPIYNLELFLLSVGLSDITPEGDGFCGDYSGVQMCAAMTDQLAVGLVGLNGQSTADLVQLAEDAGAAF